jgi:hypothetical protein
MFQQISDYLPAITSISPITIAGLGIGALGTLLYIFTRMPELLLMVATAVIYAAVPLLPTLK